ncbi:sensor domain-containing diguanylate cyclase [Marinobacter vulgaris]|nr:diguanylate cyclase [Marinobacter vulgaris]TSJ68639.1 GGDEF domain-containing protein [Marinobacter vulgaris]
MPRAIGYQPLLQKSLATLCRVAMTLCLLVAAIPAASALAPVDITQTDDTLQLGPYLEYLKDPDRREDLAEVRASNELFTPHTGDVLNIGYTSAGHWVRFRLTNTGTEPQTRYLEFRSAFVDRLTLYHPQERTGYGKTESGRLVTPPERPHPSRHFVFPITLSPGADAVYYLYADSADTLTIPLYLHTDTGLQQTVLTSRSWLSFFQGLIAAMAVFSLFLLVTLRDRVYGYYIGVIIMHQGLFFTLFNGLGYQYFGLENPWWSREALSILVSLTMLMIMQFTRVLLDTRNQQPRLDRVIAAIQCAAIAIAGLSLFVDYYLSIRLANLHGSVTALAVWVVGWNALRKDHPAARYFLIAWTSLIVGGLTYSLKSWGLLPSNAFTEHSWQIGAAIEAIFLSLAIADRITNESRQRIRLQYEAQQAQATALEIQRRANETLEKSVRERTEELREANRKLQQLSDTDQLTGISNRRSLERYLQHTFERALVDRKPVAVLLIDIDHFKPVNDTYGHQAGDDCLKEIAERIRSSVASEPVNTRAGPLGLTISMGVYAAAPVKGDSAENFLQKAHQALYRSKHEGRDRVTPFR